MSFRGGRGGGRFRGRGMFGRASNKPLILFPPEVELPEVRNVTKEEINLIAYGSRLQSFWASSPYHLTENGQSKEEEESITDEKNQNKAYKHKLYDYIKCGIDNVPAELAEGASKSGQNSRKKVRWSQGSEWKKLDLFEKLEQKCQVKEGGGGGEEEEEEEEEEVAEEDEEYSDEGDYNQNVDFEDDDDDYNMADDGNDEPTY